MKIRRFWGDLRRQNGKSYKEAGSTSVWEAIGTWYQLQESEGKLKALPLNGDLALWALGAMEGFKGCVYEYVLVCVCARARARICVCS